MYLDEFISMAWNLDLWGTGNPLVLELTFWLAVVGVSALLLALRPRFLERAESTWDRVARRRILSVVLVGTAALALRASMLPLAPIPEPVLHDEYSFILQAQTFVAGRLTNPSHPMWEHFEAFHVNMRPTYEAMYPPAQALFLAVGLLTFGHPWWGVWLSVGLMCAAVTWMLQGWMPPRWALLGGAFCVLRFALFGYFIDSYFGGAVPALGGALMMGALPRLWKKPAAGNAMALALGLVILANSRPYEGLVLSLAPLAWMTVWLLRKHAWRGQIFARVVVPATAVLVLCGAGMLYYNWRGTGNPLDMPYAANWRQYHITKPFLWQASYHIPNYHHPLMRRFYLAQEFPGHLLARSRWGLEELAQVRCRTYYNFYVWPLFLLLLPSLWIMLKSRRVRVFPIALLLLLAGLLVEAWPPQPHYASPAICVLVAVALYGLRLLRTWRPLRMPAGLMISRAIVLLLLAWMAFPTARALVNPLSLSPWGGDRPLQFERARLQAQLERLPGEHVVIVHSPASYGGSVDWIYNRPDIDLAKVIWARDMGTDRNQELVTYFRNRHIWYIDQDDGVMRLQAYNQHSTEDTLAASRVTPPQGPAN
jgi:hypothetical protein